MLLLALSLSASAQAYESEPQPMEVSDLVPVFDGAEFDTGWLPADFPIAVRFQIVADGGAFVWMEGEGDMSWPEALTLALKGEPGTGELTVDTEIDAVTSLKFDIDVYSYEAELDRRSLEDIEAEVEFDPWLLPGSPEESATAVYLGDGTELIEYSFTVFTGVDLVFTTEVVPTSTISMFGQSWTTYDGFIEYFGDTIQVEPSGDASQEIDATFAALFDTYYAFVFTPVVEICITGFGCTELVSYDIDLPLLDDSTEWEFPVQQLDFPLPLLATDIESYDFGEVEIGRIKNLEVAVANEGLMDLEGEAVITGDGEFSAYPNYFLAGPGYEDGVVVTFAPEVAGPYEGTLALTSNDPFQPEKLITFTALAVDPNAPEGEGSGDQAASSTTVSTELKGCGCSSASAGEARGMAWMMAGIAGLAFLRRRREA